MSLLDSDSEIIEKSQKNKTTTGRKSGSAGVSRFKSLNRFGNLTEQYRKKESTQNSTSAKEIVETSKLEATPSIQEVTTPIERIENIVEPVMSQEVVEIKKEQIKLETKQTDIIQSSKSSQPESKQVSKRVLSDSIQIPQQSSNRVQIDSNLNVGTVVGLQRETLNLFYQLSKQRGSRVIGPITREEISAHLKKHKENIKTVLYRLCKKGFLNRVGSKEGRGGFLMLEIPINVYQQLSMNESTVQNFNNINTKQSSQQSSQPYSSSSINIINKEETTTTIKFEDLPIEWRSIQTPENVKKYGFGQTQILSLYKKQVVTPDQIQESLNHLSFNLDRNLVKSSIGPVGMLIGILNKGEAYISTGYIEELEREAQKQKEAIERYEALKKEMVQNELVSKFESFYSNLSKEQRDYLSPPTDVFKSGSDMQMMQIRSLYINSNGKLEVK